MVDRDLFPRSVDINSTSRCNLDCPMCWGPDHTTPDALNTSQWETIISFFADNGSDAIVYTGGDPLIRNDTPELIRFSKTRGMRVTLSTNTILLARNFARLVPYVDEIGIPMDASTSERNLIMRPGRVNSFSFQLEALSMVKATAPKINVTVRTVVTKRNIDDMSAIGELLANHRANFDRWKLYQFSPFSYGEINKKEYQITDKEFLSVVGEVIKKFPDYRIDAQPSSFQEGRYVFVGSQGDIYGVAGGKYISVGNFSNHAESELKKRIQAIFDPVKNARHAHTLEVA